MKKIITIASVLLVIAILALLFIKSCGTDNSVPVPTPIQTQPEPQPEPVIEPEPEPEPEEISEPTPTPESTPTPAPTIIRIPQPQPQIPAPTPAPAPEPVIQPEPEPTPEPVIEPEITIQTEETPEVVETADAADEYIRRKHNISISAGTGLAAADTSNSLIHNNANLAEGYTMQTSFVAEIAYFYRFNDYVAIEPFISYSAEKQTLIARAANNRYNLEHTAIAAGTNILGIMPVQNFDIYALAGVLYVHNILDYSSTTNQNYSQNDGSIGLQAGIGVDYILNTRLRTGIRGVYRYNNPSIDDNSTNLSKFIITGRIGIDF